MPVIEIMPRRVIEESYSCAASIAAADEIAVTIMRHDGGGNDLAVRILVNGELRTGGSSPSTYVETLAGPFADGDLLEAQLEAKDGAVEASIVAAW